MTDVTVRPGEWPAHEVGAGLGMTQAQVLGVITLTECASAE